jgi:hypothetical protein
LSAHERIVTMFGGTGFGFVGRRSLRPAAPTPMASHGRNLEGRNLEPLLRYVLAWRQGMSSIDLISSGAGMCTISRTILVMPVALSGGRSYWAAKLLHGFAVEGVT